MVKTCNFVETEKRAGSRAGKDNDNIDKQSG